MDNRISSALNVVNCSTMGRLAQKLDAELDRMRRFVGLDQVNWQSERR